MTAIKSALSKQVTRGEMLTQIVIILISILGVAQFTHIFAAQPSQTSNTASVGATGATGANGSNGAAGANGEPGAAGSRGANGIRGLAGATGENGVPGSTGSAGIPGILSSAYGQFSGSNQEIDFSTPNEWVPIPFNVVGPSSGTTVSTTSPATITVDESGVCQVTASIYFSAWESMEATYTPTVYKLGVKIGSADVTLVSAVYAADSGHFTLNLNDIIDLSNGETVQFYISASDTEMGPFANVVTLESGSAYVMQISE